MEEKIAEHKAHHYLAITLASFAVLAAALFFYWWGWLRFEQYTDDAYVGGNRIVINAQREGTITAIYADEPDVVEEGAKLLDLDPTEAKLELELNEARLGERVREVCERFKKVSELKAVQEERKAEASKKMLDFEHRKKLVNSGAVSVEDFEDSEADFIAAFASFIAAGEAVKRAQAEVVGTTVETHPLVEAAKSEVRRAYLYLKRCQVFSPARGVLAQRRAQVGEWIRNETPLLSIVPLDQMWVEANFKETQLAKIRLGQPVKMHADMYGGSVTYHGKVIGVGGGTGSVFSLLPPQNATGNWIKILQRLPVRIGFDPEEVRAHPLRLGLSLEVTVDIHDVEGVAVPEVKPEKALYESGIFALEEEGVEELIEEIVRANIS